jgi:hypothetical protein
LVLGLAIVTLVRMIAGIAVGLGGLVLMGSSVGSTANQAFDPSISLDDVSDNLAVMFNQAASEEGRNGLVRDGPLGEA